MHLAMNWIILGMIILMRQQSHCAFALPFAPTGLGWGVGLELTCGDSGYGKQSPALGPAWTFIGSAITDGLAGQWV